MGIYSLYVYILDCTRSTVYLLLLRCTVRKYNACAFSSTTKRVFVVTLLFRESISWQKKKRKGTFEGDFRLYCCRCLLSSYPFFTRLLKAASKQARTVSPLVASLLKISIDSVFSITPLGNYLFLLPLFLHTHASVATISKNSPDHFSNGSKLQHGILVCLGRESTSHQGSHRSYHVRFDEEVYCCDYPSTQTSTLWSTPFTVQKSKSL